MLASIGFAVFLFGVCGGLLAWQLLSRRSISDDQLDTNTRLFLRRQRRRRLQAGVLIGVVGLAVLGALWIQNPLHTLVYWLCVATLVLWIGLLAAVDMVRSRHFYRKAYDQHLAEHVSLLAQLERLRRHEGNGRKDKAPTEPSDRQDD